MQMKNDTFNQILFRKLSDLSQEPEEISNSEKELFKKITSTLSKNNLICVKIPKHQTNLLMTISQALYNSIKYTNEIQNKVLKYLKDLIQLKKLPSMLNAFKNQDLLQEYEQNFSSLEFHRVTLELVCLVFEIQIIVYYISSDDSLNSLIINNGFDKKIEILKIQNHFDALISKKHDAAIKFIINNIDDSSQKLRSQKINSSYFIQQQNNQQILELPKQQYHTHQLYNTKQKSNISQKNIYDLFNGNIPNFQNFPIPNKSYIFEQQPPLIIDRNNEQLSQSIIDSNQQQQLQQQQIIMKNNMQICQQQYQQLQQNNHQIFQIVNDGFNEQQQLFQQKQNILNNQQQNVIYDNDKQINQQIIDEKELSFNKLGRQKSLSQDSPPKNYMKTAQLESNKLEKQPNDQQLPEQYFTSNYRLQNHSVSNDSISSQENDLNLCSHQNILQSQEPQQIIQKETSQNFKQLSDLMINQNPGSNQQLQALKMPIPQFSSNSMNQLFNLKNNLIQSNECKNLDFMINHRKLSGSSSGGFQKEQFNEEIPGVIYQENLNKLNIPQCLQNDNEQKLLSPLQNIQDPKQLQDPLKNFNLFDQQLHFNQMKMSNSNQGSDRNIMMMDQNLNFLKNQVNQAHRFQGRIKFFDESKNYGFIVKDINQQDIFVHYDNLIQAGIDKIMLKNIRQGQIIKVSFTQMQYIGKYDMSFKAIDLVLL